MQNFMVAVMALLCSGAIHPTENSFFFVRHAACVHFSLLLLLVNARVSNDKLSQFCDVKIDKRLYLLLLLHYGNELPRADVEHSFLSAAASL